MKDFLTLKEFRFYLTYGTQTIEIKDPDGWDKISPNYSRERSYQTTIRSWTLPIKFVRDAASFIRNVIYRYGIESKIFLKIERLNNSYTYDTYFEGVLDLSQPVDADNNVEVNALESSLYDLIEKNKTTKYELDGLTFDDITHDGIELISLVQCQVSERNVEAPIDLVAEQAKSKPVRVIGQTIDNKEVPTGIEQVFVLSNNISVDRITQLNTPSFQAISNGTLAVQLLDFSIGYLRVFIGIPIELSFELIREREGVFTRVAYQLLQIVNTTAENYGEYDGYFGYNFTKTVITVKNDRFYCIIKALPTPGFTSITEIKQPIYFERGSINYSYVARYETTTIKATYPSLIYKKLVEKITGLADIVIDADKYDYYDFFAFTNTLYLTNGDRIRGINSNLKYNYDDFVKSMFVLTGYLPKFNHVTGKINIIHMSELYSNTLIANIGDVREMKITIASDLIYSKVTIGCGDYDYDSLNGKYEWSNNVEYTQSINNGELLELVSKIRTDVYGIEKIRVLTGAQPTTDKKEDDDLFCLYYGDYGLDRLTRITAGHPLPNTMYNTVFNAPRLLESFKPWINSGGKMTKKNTISFGSAEKNKNAVFDYGGAINETKSVNINGDNYFTPLYFEFSTKGVDGIAKLIEANPYGYIQFNYRGYVFKGYIIDVSENPSRQEPQTYRLLAHADTDLTKLITIDYETEKNIIQPSTINEDFTLWTGVFPNENPSNPLLIPTWSSGAPNAYHY